MKSTSATTLILQKRLLERAKQSAMLGNQLLSQRKPKQPPTTVASVEQEAEALSTKQSKKLRKLLASSQLKKLTRSLPDLREEDLLAALEEIKPRPWTPYKWQKRGIKWLLEHAGAGLFADPGTGKTSITLGAVKILKQERVLRRALVFAPRRVCHRVWPVERHKWTDFHGLRIAVLHGKHKERAAEEDADVYVCNPEGLPWLVENKIIDQLQPDTLIVDESSKFKHTDTQRFHLLKPYLPTFDRRWILTGSPNPNGYVDLFGQIYMIDLGRALGPYITHYRNEHFYQTGYGGFEWKLMDGHEKQIHKAIKPYIYRLDAEELLDLPEIVNNVIRVDLPAKVSDVYQELETEMFAELESGQTIRAISAGALTNKCSQIANGGIYYVPDGASKRSTAHLHNAKTEALVDLFDELQGSPLLVAYEFQHDLERMLHVFGKNTPVMGGGTSDKRTEQLERLWNSGRIPLLLAHPAAMGHGLNLQDGGCHNVAWYGITWDYELYDQFIKRVRRQGNKAHHVFVHHFVAANTVDEVKLRTLAGKEQTQRGLLNALRTYRKQKTL